MSQLLKQLAVSEFLGWPQDVQQACVDAFRGHGPRVVASSNGNGKQRCTDDSRRCNKRWTEDELERIHQQFENMGVWSNEFGNHLAKLFGRSLKAIQDKHREWKATKGASNPDPDSLFPSA